MAKELEWLFPLVPTPTLYLVDSPRVLGMGGSYRDRERFSGGRLCDQVDMVVHEAERPDQNSSEGAEPVEEGEIEFAIRNGEEDVSIVDCLVA